MVQCGILGQYAEEIGYYKSISTYYAHGKQERSEFVPRSREIKLVWIDLIELDIFDKIRFKHSFH